MACQIFRWLIAGAGPTTLQHALVGVGCLLAFDITNRWWKRRPKSGSGDQSRRDVQPQMQRRRAA
jgi:hypothetical protein